VLLKLDSGPLDGVSGQQGLDVSRYGQSIPLLVNCTCVYKEKAIDFIDGKPLEKRFECIVFALPPVFSN